MRQSTSRRSETGYREATGWLFGLKRFAPKAGLGNTKRLLKLLGDPHRSFRSIHITGTNGKGSTAVMIASILTEAGYRVGLFTSPHLSDFTERIVVDGKRIAERDVVRIVEMIKSSIGATKKNRPLRPTFFEMVTALAFAYFAEKSVDFAVVEAGMGGRKDPTNILYPLVSVITNVSLEHTEHLGNTVMKIAREKAGIIKEGVALVTAAEDDDVFALFERTCKRKGSRIFRVGRDIRFEKSGSNLRGQRFNLDGPFGRLEGLFVPLLGSHQLANAAAAVGAVEALGYYGIKIREKAVAGGLEKVRWPGRLEIMQRHPLVVLDCAKDPAAAGKLGEAIKENFKYERLVMVVSISKDKDIRSMMDSIAPVADIVIAAGHKAMGRAAEPSAISHEAERHSKPAMVIRDVKDAAKKAISIAGKDGMVCVTGSVFTVGEAREMWGRASESI